MTLADKIIQERKKNGWSQEELAERVNVSRQAVSKWERGMGCPDVSLLSALSSVLQVQVDALAFIEGGAGYYQISIPIRMELVH